jgi:protein gp37
MNRNTDPANWWDWTFNPIVGCSPVSAGCDHCYAAAVSRRFGLPWGRAHFLPDRLGQPAKVKKPSFVFVGSMTDLGHETVDPAWIKAVADAMRRAPWHTYMVLTKRPGPWLRYLPPACWVGVTIENREHYNRWPLLWNWSWPGALKFISVEPMLGRVDPIWWPWGRPDWVIVGQETGPGARPCDMPALLDMRRDCWAAGVPFWDKRPGVRQRQRPAGKGTVAL